MAVHKDGNDDDDKDDKEDYNVCVFAEAPCFIPQSILPLCQHNK